MSDVTGIGPRNYEQDRVDPGDVTSPVLTKRFSSHLNGGSKFSAMVYRIYADERPTDIYEHTVTDGSPHYHITGITLVCGDERLELTRHGGKEAVDWVLARLPGRAPQEQSPLRVKKAMSTSPARPVMRYHGGKWKIAPWIIGHFPPHLLYVEAFCGAGSVLMRKPRSRAEVLNDLDGEVVNVFRVLRDPSTAARLEQLLRLTPFAREEFYASYALTDDPVEQARHTLTRRMMGFGTSGLVQTRTGFRATTHRNRHTGYSSDWARYPDHVRAFCERLTGVTIEQEPALKLLDRHDQPNALWYLDPPYLHSTRSGIGSPDELGARHNGYRHEMTDDDHRALAERVRHAKAMVVVSGYPSDLYDRELYAGWHRVQKDRVGTQGQRGMIGRTEVLWLNPACVEALGPFGVGSP